MKKLIILLLAGLMLTSVVGCSGSNINEDDDEIMFQTEDEVTYKGKDNDDNSDNDDENAIAGDRNFDSKSSDFRDFISGCRIVISDAMSDLTQYYDTDFYATDAALYLNSMSSYALDLACERIFSGDVEDAIDDIKSYLYITASEYNVDGANGSAVVKGTDIDGEEAIITVEYDGSSTAQCVVRDGAGNLTWYVSYTKCDNYVAYSYAVEAITTISIKFNNGDTLYVFDRKNPLENYYTVFENNTITTADLTEKNLYLGTVDGVFVNKSE